MEALCVEHLRNNGKSFDKSGSKSIQRGCLRLFSPLVLSLFWPFDHILSKITEPDKLKLKPFDVLCEKSWSLAICRILETLIADLLTSKSSRVIFVPECNDQTANVVKFLKRFMKSRVHKLLETHARTQGQSENMFQHRSTDGGGGTYLRMS